MRRKEGKKEGRWEGRKEEKEAGRNEGMDGKNQRKTVKKEKYQSISEPTYVPFDTL